MKAAYNSILILVFCTALRLTAQDNPIPIKQGGLTKPGSESTGLYLSELKNKAVGVVANQTSLLGSSHLIDSLLGLQINIEVIFTPEHGFRGEADAGAYIEDGKDKQTGIGLVSLYGNHKKPKKEDMDMLDVVIFDLQDVGLRFYTYISTLTYVMEACAEQKIPLIVLDRPNPNGCYIDGPILEEEYRSFVGLHPVPIVYGMTIGEYALMVNGEGWLENRKACELTVIPLSNYDRNAIDKLPVKPSPNLPNYKAIFLYPSLCLFEGTTVSIGRGTAYPFQVYGHPEFPETSFSFTPQSRSGATKPKHNDVICNGYDLRSFASNPDRKEARIHLQWLIQAYQKLSQSVFFNPYFEKLAGTRELRLQIEQGISEEEIRKSWQPGLLQFKKTRAKYLIYPDFDQ